MNYSEKYENISFTNNFAFCKVMQNEEICREVIETLLHIKVGRLEYKSFEKDLKLEIDKRGIRLDVYIADSDRVFDLEMQTTDKKNLGCRMRYYQSLIDAELLDKGANFNDLKESNIIFFCTFDPFRKGLPQYTFCNSCEELPDLKLDDKCRKIAYNVNAFEKVDDEKIRKLLEFISTGKSETPLTNKICKELKRVQGNEEWRAEYMTWEMLKQDTYDSGFSAGEEYGRSEGIAIGEERGISLGEHKKAVETAKNLIDLGLPQEQIALVTGLSVEEIEKL
ncbi:MAG: Rpn family recombination-promoting nuclease/putative transposase [Spirochaetales bacterium]|nr:Rpn family recombination-promoting nuclease/putative transposase [Spirochaetales bacterium]